MIGKIKNIFKKGKDIEEKMPSEIQNFLKLAENCNENTKKELIEIFSGFDKSAIDDFIKFFGNVKSKKEFRKILKKKIDVFTVGESPLSIEDLIKIMFLTFDCRYNDRLFKSEYTRLVYKSSLKTKKRMLKKLES